MHWQNLMCSLVVAQLERSQSCWLQLPGASNFGILFKCWEVAGPFYLLEVEYKRGRKENDIKGREYAVVGVCRHR
jgi:hypothetical protein